MFSRFLRERAEMFVLAWNGLQRNSFDLLQEEKDGRTADRGGIQNSLCILPLAAFHERSANAFKC